MVQKSNLNLDFGETLLERRYINIAKSAQRIASTGGDFYLNINVNDYPTDGVTSFTSLFYFPIPSGTYVARWLGSGSFTSGAVSNKTNSSKGVYTGGGANGSVVTNGRFTFTGPASTALFTITGTTMSNLVVCLLSEEDALDGGQEFRTQFLERIAAFNPSYLRLMDCQLANVSILRNWSDRPSVDKLTYQGTIFIPDRKVGVMTGTNDYVASSYTGMPASYQRGEFIHGTWQNSNTLADCTLDVGGRGPKPVYMDFGSKPATSGGVTVKLIQDWPYTAVYDDIFDRWFVNQLGANVGQPIESLIALCNATGKAGWFSIPFYASDDWITNLAQTICSTYQPDKVRFEYINECWNFLFWPTGRSAQYGTSVFGLSGGNLANLSGWYGYRFRQAAEIIRPIFASANQSNKVNMYLGCRFADGATVTAITNLVENVRFKNDSVPELSGSNAPILHADYVGYANYYYPNAFAWQDSQYTAFSQAILTDLKLAVDSYIVGDTATAFQWAKNAYLGTDSTYEIATRALNRFENYNNLAASYGVKVAMYEANHEQAGPSASWASSHAPFNDSSYGGTTGKINLFILAFWASQQYYDAMWTILETWYAYSQSEEFSLYAYGQGQPWIVFQGGDPLNDPYQNWNAHAVWNNPAVAQSQVYQSPNVGGAGAPTIRRRAQYESYDTIVRRQKIREIEELKAAILARGPTPKLAEKAREFIAYNDGMSIRALVAELARAQQELEDEEEMIILALLH